LGVMVMPSVGFDVVPSDCLAVHVSRLAGNADSLHVGISGLELVSRGSAKTLIEMLDKPTLGRRNGHLVASAYFSTGIGEVTTYFEATPAVRVHTGMMRAFGWAIPFTPWQPLLSALVGFLPEGPTSRERGEREAVVVVEAEAGGRVVARSRLRTPEAYSFTAESGIAIARRVLEGDLQPGFQTPARVFGPDFVLGLSRVRREDL
jgi:short subunit dehydrogenase-like uncharacterized protein